MNPSISYLQLTLWSLLLQATTANSRRRVQLSIAVSFSALNNTMYCTARLTYRLTSSVILAGGAGGVPAGGGADLSLADC